ncbi:hypothetical protein KR054_002014 [Drosophila jambulina]|nr:hypothetical protein KR054_002014 [Drosophila jambulina]
MPELWLVRSKPYRNRRLKDESYGRLLTLMRQIDPHANSHSLKRKINNFRTSYRRELRKVLRSGHTYVPGLWYFKDLDFLCELETGVLQYDDSIEKEVEMEMEMEPEPLAQQDQEYPQLITDEGETMGRIQLKAGKTENMGANEINEDDDIFAGSFHKEEDVLGGMEPVSDGEADAEPYLDTEADADPDLESEPIITVRHRTDLKEIKNDFHDTTTSNQSRSGSREGHSLDKSSRSNMRRIRRRRSSNNASDYDDNSRQQQGKRQRVTEDLSSDRNRDRVIDRESDSECELIGRRMAAHFRNMRPDQRLFAERIISEVLVFGRMNRLSFDSQFIPNRK